MVRNCFTYVINKMKNEDGYILIRRSRLNQEYNISSKWHPISWLPHFLHRSVDGVITQYTITEEQLKADHSSSMTYIIKYLFGSILGMLFFILICLNIIAVLLFSMCWSFNGRIIGDEVNKTEIF